jgi:hypothetical protein
MALRHELIEAGLNEAVAATVRRKQLQDQLYWMGSDRIASRYTAFVHIGTDDRKSPVRS